MKKILLPLLLILLSFNTVSAATLTLTHIGALNTGGAMYNEWWYSGLNPTLRGTANSSSEVNVTIDDTSYTTQSDSSGMWSLSTTMTQGDYDITIESEGETYSFTLHNGQAFSGMTTTTTQTTQSTTPVPDTGSQQLPAAIMASGLMLLGIYYWKYGRENALNSFEKEMVR